MPEGLLGAAAPPGDGLAPRFDIYPERTAEVLSDLDERVAAALAPARRLFSRARVADYRRAAARVDRLERRVATLSRAMLADEGLRLREALRSGLPHPSDRWRALAVTREIARRATGMRAHRVQLMGALAILDGRLVEMATGEGKSLTAALAAAVAALSGRVTHVVTVTDVLAERDAATFAPLFATLQLSAGAIVHETDPQKRRRRYAGNIVYVSNKEVAFDHLRDRVRMGGAPDVARLKLERLGGSAPDESRRPVMAGLDFAIVDEADSVLVDEVRTPLILSRETDVAAEARWAADAFHWLDRLAPGEDYTVDAAERRVAITAAGRARLEAMAATAGPEWQNRIRREETVRQAASARDLFRRGEHYVVRDGKVVIVDEYTGRLMPERSWSGGLHQLVEHKEGVPVSSRKLTIASMTYQRFFARYRQLSGMTGTAREVAGELAHVFGLEMVKVPTHRRSRLTRFASRVVPDQAAKWEAVVDRVRGMTAAGRPVLVGTRSVAASEAASAALRRAGLAHVVLNALDDAAEAAIISQAGTAGRVTVATNMAGRGVHIALGPGVAEAGGLHVILTERHDSRRIDRQLEGRTARQGLPGSTEAILALDDPILAIRPTPFLQSLSGVPWPVGHAARTLLFRVAQVRAEWANARARRALVARDRQLRTLIAYGGKSD